MDVQKKLSLLNSCITSNSWKSLAKTKLLHSKSISLGLWSDTEVTKSLVNLYAFFRNFDSALLVLQSIPKPSDVSPWNALLSSFSKNQLYSQTLCLFDKLLSNNVGLKPDRYSYPSAMKACAGLRDAVYGMKIHSLVIRFGFVSDVVVSSSVVMMYGKCGQFGAAVRLFDEMSQRDNACWNTVLSCYFQDGQPSKALDMFQTMKNCGFMPDSVTFTTVFSACARLLDLERGKEIHEELVRSGLELDGYVSSALVDMYGKCGSLEMAREIFEQIKVKTVVSWNSMIGGYSLKGDARACLELFMRMNLEGIRPTSTTICNLLIVCSKTSYVRYGKLIHGYFIRHHIDVDAFLGCSLVDLYFKSRNISYAVSVFKLMPKDNTVLWNVMISGYVNMGYYFEALDVFHEMKTFGVVPDAASFTSALSACAQLPALYQGKEIHNQIRNLRLDLNVNVMTALLDMYAKCGGVREARLVFDCLPEKDVVSWTSMITAYGSHGKAIEALELFQEMQVSRVKVDKVTFLAVFTACSHGGLIDQGLFYFRQMIHEYGIEPDLEHYSCFIDLLGRSGRLNEALHILQGMHDIKVDARLLGSLFAACTLFKNFILGEQIGELLLEMDPHDHSVYVGLTNIYAFANKWDKVGTLRAKMKDRGLRKHPGCSWIDVNMEFHQFFVRDYSHKESNRIYECLDFLSRHMEKRKTWKFGEHL